MKICYLFTTFPLLSETPYQRDLRALARQPVEFEIWSLWSGGGSFAGITVKRFVKWRAVALPWFLLYWLWRKPRVLLGFFARFAHQGLRQPLNAGETVLGAAFALCYARSFLREAEPPDLFYGAWATLPASAAQLLAELTGRPFAMGAHAYDVFRNGGDWDLERKLAKATLVVTSSASTERALLARGASPERTVLIRRGLETLPRLKSPRRERIPLRILAVGRLIEKKGYAEQLEVYARLKAMAVPFEAHIVGEGPLRPSLEKRRDELGLNGEVTLIGAMSHELVLDQYEWADVLLFTGKVARSGDRDGLPNVVPEAMAYGVPVVATCVAGVPEAVEDGRSGILVRGDCVTSCANAVKQLQIDNGLYERLIAGARAWVEANYDAGINSRRLLYHFEAAVVAAKERKVL